MPVRHQWVLVQTRTDGEMDIRNLNSPTQSVIRLKLVRLIRVQPIQLLRELAVLRRVDRLRLRADVRMLAREKRAQLELERLLSMRG